MPMVMARSQSGLSRTSARSFRTCCCRSSSTRRSRTAVVPSTSGMWLARSWQSCVIVRRTSSKRSSARWVFRSKTTCGVLVRRHRSSASVKRTAQTSATTWIGEPSGSSRPPSSRLDRRSEARWVRKPRHRPAMLARGLRRSRATRSLILPRPCRPHRRRRSRRVSQPQPPSAPQPPSLLNRAIPLRCPRPMRSSARPASVVCATQTSRRTSASRWSASRSTSQAGRRTACSRRFRTPASSSTGWDDRACAVRLSDLPFRSQDYLKAIFDVQEWSGTGVGLTQLAAKVGQQNSTASEAVKRLAAQGLVNHRPYAPITLTDLGYELAIQMVRRHRLIETYLCRELGYSLDEVHDEAEELEHAVSDKFLARIDELMGYPDRDPHGDPIPNVAGQLPE